MQQIPELRNYINLGGLYMNNQSLPKAWGSFINRQDTTPVIVKALEKICDTSWAMKASKHDHYEMIYVKKGNALFNIGGTDISMAPNDILIIKPGQLHKFVVKSEISFEFIVLSFKFETNGTTNTETSVADFIEFLSSDRSSAFVHLKLNKKNDIVTVMNRIQREQDKQQVWGDFLSYLLIMELFVLLSRTLKIEFDHSFNNHSLKLKELLHIAKDYIDNNYDKELSLANVSKCVYLSESYFAHTFKDEFNISPKSYLLSVRIEASKELLANTDMRVNDVALSVGFSSQQRYNDIFRKHTNMTPLKYRRLERANRINNAN